MTMALLADRDTVTCFKLGGLANTFIVENPKEAKKYLSEFFEEKKFKIILVSERLLNQIEIFEKIAECQFPLIIPIPDLKGSNGLKIDFIAENIRRKTGIEVKF
jgi:V/A-type H+-transporting ATPase subunit F